VTASPPIPFALDPYLPPGVLRTLAAAEVGYLYRLCEFAWSAVPPCRLPGPLDGLAIVAGAGPSEWATSAGRVMRAFRAEADGSYTAVELLAAFESAMALRAKRAESGRLGGDAKAGKCQALAKQVPSTCQSHGGSDVRVRARSAPDRALALLRSPETEISLSAPDGAVIASLGARARALGDERVAEWKRKQSLAMLTDALSRWRASGLSTFPTQKAAELAGGQWSDPARVETAIASADAFVSDRKAQGRVANPVGRLINALGLSHDGQRRLIEPYAALARKWDDKLAMYVSALRAQAAIEAQRANVSRNHGAVGEVAS